MIRFPYDSQQNSAKITDVRFQTTSSGKFWAETSR